MDNLKKYSDSYLQDELDRRKFKHITPPMPRNSEPIAPWWSVVKMAHQDLVDIRIKIEVARVKQREKGADCSGSYLYNDLEAKEDEIKNLVWDMFYKETRPEWVLRLRNLPKGKDDGQSNTITSKE